MPANKTRKNKNLVGTQKRYRKKRVYTKKHFKSGDGMLTTVWGPSLWHYMHTMSFNYPIKPTDKDKKYYKDFIINLQHVLPCKYCRDNLKKNFKAHPLRMCDMKNRDTYSRYVYELHETVNKMLGKKSGLTYCDVRKDTSIFEFIAQMINLKCLNLERIKLKERVHRTIVWKKI